MDLNITQTRHPGKPRILIVGGVAGGASCAARARRLSEDAEIIIFERGPHVSFASCGLPYYVGEVITEEKNLLVATPDLFRKRFNIQVKLRHEVLSINREKQTIEVKNLENGDVYQEPYDNLVLSTGTEPVKLPVPGINLPGIFTMRTISDSNRIKAWIAEKKVKRAAVIGGGFIGLEATENLVNLGISVTIIEMLPQVMSSLDPEIAIRLQDHLLENKVELLLGDAVSRFEKKLGNENIGIKTRSGANLDFDMVILATGVRPEVSLANQAGLKIGERGGVRVDEQMHTSDKRIWAVGDAAEVRNFVTGDWCLIPLAGPASRQGRIAADAIMGRNTKFRGVQGTMVCKAFGVTVAATGISEKMLLGIGKKINYQKVYLHPGNHAGYYPGAKTITMKLIFSTEDGKILGAQAAGEEGVEKRIDVISMAIQKEATVYDLEEAEMCYAPQFGSAKDPVNFAGMIAANDLRGDSPLEHWKDIDLSKYFLLDVRDPGEFKSGHVEGATNIPLPEIRKRISEVPNDKEVAVYCGVGQRSYYATRILRQNGFAAKNISGGITSYKAQSKVKG